MTKTREKKEKDILDQRKAVFVLWDWRLSLG